MRATTRATLTLGLGLAALAACNDRGGRSDHPGDGDTGQASPNATPTPNNPSIPDSANGVGQRTGQPGVAGDTLSSKAPGGAVPPAGDPKRP